MCCSRSFLLVVAIAVSDRCGDLLGAASCRPSPASCGLASAQRTERPRAVRRRPPAQMDARLPPVGGCHGDISRPAAGAPMPSRPTRLPRCERPETPDFFDASRCSGPAAPGDGAQTGPRKPDGVGAEMMLSVLSTLFTTPTPGLPRERLRKSRRGRGTRYQAALLDEHSGTSAPQRGGPADAQPKRARPDPRCRRTDRARPTFSLHSSFRRGAAAAEGDVSSPTAAKPPSDLLHSKAHQRPGSGDGATASAQADT